MSVMLARQFLVKWQGYSEQAWPLLRASSREVGSNGGACRVKGLGMFRFRYLGQPSGAGGFRVWVWGLLVGYAFLLEGSHTRHNLLKALNQALDLHPLKSVPSTPQPLTPHLQEPPEAVNVKPYAVTPDG